MTTKLTTALITAMTFAFAAPAFANETPPADDLTEASVTTETTIETQTTTETETESLLKATPSETESEVAGEFTVNIDSFTPTFGDVDLSVESESAIDIAAPQENVSDAEDDIRVPQAPDVPDGPE